MRSRPVFQLQLDPPVHGWIGGVATTGDDRLGLIASYLNDTPRELVVAAARCLRGDRGRVVWVEEPHSKVWTLEPEGAAVRLLVQGCRGLGPSFNESFDPTSEETYVIPRREFAVAVLEAFDLMLLDAPEGAYEQGWRLPFPAEELTGLRRALGRPLRAHHR